jgi:hypothetical protein
MLKKLVFFLVCLILLGLIAIFILADPFQKKSRAGLQIEYPQGSGSVFLGDTYLGRAPLLEEKLQSGEHILKITPDDPKLSSLNLPIYLEGGTLTIVVFNPGENPRNSSSTIFELRKRADKSSAVSFETYPENAFISFDDKEINFSPLTITEVSPGEHHFSVNLPSYEAQEHSFLVLEGYETKITISLAKNIRLMEKEPEEISDTSNLIQVKMNQSNPESTQSGLVQGGSSQSEEIIGAKVEILKTGYFADNQEVLKVRNASSSSAAEIGAAKVGYFFPYLGEKSSDQKWLKIKFNEQQAWVSSDFAKIIGDDQNIVNDEPK